MAQARKRPRPTANVAPAVPPTTTSSTSTAQQSQTLVDPQVLDALQGRTQPDYIVTPAGSMINIVFQSALTRGTPLPLPLPPFSAQGTWTLPPQPPISFVASGATVPGIDPCYTSGLAEGSSARKGNRQDAPAPASMAVALGPGAAEVKVDPSSGGAVAASAPSELKVEPEDA